MNIADWKPENIIVDLKKQCQTDLEIVKKKNNPVNIKSRY